MGGRAFKDITRRVSKGEVIATTLWLQCELPWTKFGGEPFIFNLLGSAGQKDESGDIDINVDAQCADFDEAIQLLETLLGAEYVWARPGNSQIFCAVPINGDPTKGRVQVDFMFGDWLWQKFSYASPGQDSAFKGLYRTELIKALVAYNSDWTLVEDGELVARVGPTFFDSKGLVWRYRHRPYGKKDPTKRVKAFAEICEDEFFDLYPLCNKISHSRMSDPNDVIKFLLGSEATMQDFYSYETLFVVLRQTYNETELAQINRIYFERLNSLKVELPDLVL